MRKTKTTADLKPLAEKLRAIRLIRDMSQTDIFALVYPKADETHRAMVSQWENALREPDRKVLIRYARIAGISLEELLVDEIALPLHITGGYDKRRGDIRKKRESEAVREKDLYSREDETFQQSENTSPKTKVNLYLNTEIKRRTERAQLELRREAVPQFAGQINYSLIVETALEIVFDEFDRIRKASRLNQEITKKINNK